MKTQRLRTVHKRMALSFCFLFLIIFCAIITGLTYSAFSARAQASGRITFITHKVSIVASGNGTVNINEFQAISNATLSVNGDNLIYLGINKVVATPNTGYQTEWQNVPNVPVTQDVTITAKFNPITYNITYDLAGGKPPAIANPTTYNIETETFTLNNPTRTGYTFAGWTGSNGNTPQTTVTINVGSMGDKSYTANWQINEVYFNNQTLNEGTYGTDYTSNAFSPATSGSGSFTYSIISGAPNGASIDSANRTISFTNTTNVGTYSVVVRASDNTFGIYKDATMTIVINKASSSITLSQDSIEIVNQTYSTVEINSIVGDGEFLLLQNDLSIAAVTLSDNTITIRGYNCGVTTAVFKLSESLNYYETSKVLNIRVVRPAITFNSSTYTIKTVDNVPIIDNTITLYPEYGTYELYDAEIDGNQVHVPTVSSLDGYTFSGWYDESIDGRLMIRGAESGMYAGDSRSYPSTYDIKADITLYAHCKAFSEYNYPVTFYYWKVDPNNPDDINLNSCKLVGSGYVKYSSTGYFNPSGSMNSIIGDGCEFLSYDSSKTILFDGTSIVDVFVLANTTYTITWIDVDGNVIETDDNVYSGDNIKFNSFDKISGNANFIEYFPKIDQTVRFSRTYMVLCPEDDKCIIRLEYDPTSTSLDSSSVISAAQGATHTGIYLYDASTDMHYYVVNVANTDTYTAQLILNDQMDNSIQSALISAYAYNDANSKTPILENVDFRSDQGAITYPVANFLTSGDATKSGTSVVLNLYFNITSTYTSFKFIDITIKTTQSTGCVLEGTDITLANGQTKKVEDIGYDDLILTWNSKEGKYDKSYANWLEKETITGTYMLVTFEDSSQLKVYNDHSIFSVTHNKFINMQNKDLFRVGTRVFKHKTDANGNVVCDEFGNIISTETTVKSIEYISETFNVYFVLTNNYYNSFSNGFLTGTGDKDADFCNIFDFDENMKWKEDTYNDYVATEDFFTYEDVDFIPQFMYHTLNAKYTKYLVLSGKMSYEEIKEHCLQILASPFKPYHTMLDENGNEVIGWYITTSEEWDNLFNEDYQKKQYALGSTYTFTAPTKVVEGKTFKGWTIANSDGTLYQVGDTITVWGSMHMEAVWE